MSESELSRRVDAAMPTTLEELAQIVAIPSVSSDPARQEDLHRSAELVSQLLERLGLDARICSATAADGTPGKPAVLATRHVSDTAPTVLLYAHHDVQPTGDIELWSHPTFALTEDNGRLYGRGSADDGAGIVVHLGALRALGNKLSVNVVVFIEGEEEIGSPSFQAFLDRYREQLAADVIIVADSNNWDEETPALTASLRGVTSVEVTIRVLEHAVHSGMFGGPILDAVTLASRLIATLHDNDGSVAVRGLGGSRDADVDWNEDAFRADASVVPGYQLAGKGDLASRVWNQPALSVIGFDARSVAEASNTIAAACTFKLSLRTVPGTDPAAAQAALIQHLEENRPFGAQMTITADEVGPGYQADLDTPTAAKLRESLAAAWGKAPVNIGVGGSIPFIADFQRAFPNAEVLVTGVEDPRSNAHSEDESVAISMLRNAIVAEAQFLRDLGE